MESPIKDEDNLFQKRTTSQCPKSVISLSKNTFSNFQEENNLSIKDKVASPNVSFIQRFHCNCYHTN